MLWLDLRPTPEEEVYGWQCKAGQKPSAGRIVGPKQKYYCFVYEQNVKLPSKYLYLYPKISAAISLGPRTSA